jgi:hypothetical protein
MKLLPLEIRALVSQEIRRVMAAAQRVSEIHEEVLRQRAEWKIEYAMRTLDAGESLPAAMNFFRQYWEQCKSTLSSKGNSAPFTSGLGAC